MITLTANSPILLKLGATDMRKSFDGLCGIVRNEFGCEPTNGSFFVFVNARRDRVKILHWERDGFELWYRRLEQGTIETIRNPDNTVSASIDSTQLAMLLSGIALDSTRRKRFRQGA